MKFRYKRGIPVSYERQGYVYFKSLRYSDLPKREQIRIRQLCTEVCRYNSDALFEHVTTGKSVKDVCAKYHIASPYHYIPRAEALLSEIPTGSMR